MVMMTVMVVILATVAVVGFKRLRGLLWIHP